MVIQSPAAGRLSAAPPNRIRRKIGTRIAVIETQPRRPTRDKRMAPPNPIGILSLTGRDLSQRPRSRGWKKRAGTLTASGVFIRRRVQQLYPDFGMELQPFPGDGSALTRAELQLAKDIGNGAQRKSKLEGVALLAARGSRSCSTAPRFDNCVPRQCPAGGRSSRNSG
jgi:hypothetical protein